MIAEDRCPIWGTPCTSVASHQKLIGWLVIGSDRAGGDYEITIDAQRHVSQMDAPTKARLTTWLVDQRKQGNLRPTVTDDVLDQASSGAELSIADRAYRLLEILADKSPDVGARVFVQVGRFGSDRVETALAFPEGNKAAATNLFAETESTTTSAVASLLKHLVSEKWITELRVSGFGRPGGSGRPVQVSILGHQELARIHAKRVQSTVFIAMWFDDETNDVFDRGIQPAVEDAGYTAMRIDRKEHINRIDEEIVAEIRRSRFLIADYTQGETGARGGVYWEDGFASGLGLQVIRTCRKDCMDEIAFDTRQYNHIVWETPEGLREALKHRILAVIGEGPNTS